MPEIKNDLTKGNVLKNLVVFMMPTFLLTVVQALMNLTDMLVASNFGGVAVAAAVGMGGQMSYLIVTAVIGFSTGAAILFGKLLGEKNESGFRDAVNVYLTISAIAAVLIAAIFIPLSIPLLRLFATPKDAIDGANLYFIIQMGGMTFVLLFQAVNAVFRGRGESMPPLIFLTFGAAVNVGLDFLFLVVFQWGAAGISAATVISQFAACVAGIVWIAVKKLFPLASIRLKLKKEYVKELLKLGIPLGIENTAASISFLIMTLLVNRVGAGDAVYALTASSVGMRYNAFFMLPARATGMAISAMVAQNLGAGKDGRVKKTVFAGMAISAAAGILLTLAGFFGAEGMLKLFGNEAKVLEFGVPFLKAFSFDYVLLPISVSLFGWLDGIGKTGYSMIVNVVSSFAIRIPLAFLLSEVFRFGMVGIGVSIPATSAVAAVIMIIIVVILVKKGKKEQKRNRSVA